MAFFPSGEKGGKVLFASLCYFWVGECSALGAAGVQGVVFGGDVPLCRYDGPGCAMGVEPWGTEGQDYVSPCPPQMTITLSPFIRQRLFCAF